jgi:hypothetical protein
MYTKAPWPQYRVHLSYCAQYPGMCPFHHFTVQYMHALRHGRCMPKIYKQLTSLSTLLHLQLGFDLGILHLLYLTHSRPDLSYAVGAVSRFMQEPHELHWKAAKHILRYI